MHFNHQTSKLEVGSWNLVNLNPVFLAPHCQEWWLFFFLFLWDKNPVRVLYRHRRASLFYFQAAQATLGNVWLTMASLYHVNHQHYQSWSPFVDIVRPGLERRFYSNHLTRNPEKNSQGFITWGKFLVFGIIPASMNSVNSRIIDTKVEKRHFPLRQLFACSFPTFVSKVLTPLNCDTQK